MLTCGVDTQDNRLEFEIVGWGHWGESWGIRRGVIMGRPDEADTWERLDEVIEKIYMFRSGIGLRVSMTFVDSGGHFSQEVRLKCRERQRNRVFAIIGSTQFSAPHTAPPKQQKIVIDGKKLGNCWMYTLGVSAGKQIITDNLKVLTPGKRYCHFPHTDDYGTAYFKGLLSERLTYNPKKKQPWDWIRIPGHDRNEALDCRNYALAAFKAMPKDLDATDRKLKEAVKKLERERMNPNAPSGGQQQRQALVGGKEQKETAPIYEEGTPRRVNLERTERERPRPKSGTDKYYESW
jgi:phage terminase large subunit GpA-like protein